MGYQRRVHGDEQQHSNNHNQNNYTQQKTLRDLFLPKTTLSTTKQSKWAAAATPTALALRAPAPATNKLILSPTDLSVPSPASTTMAQNNAVELKYDSSCKYSSGKLCAHWD